MPRRLIAVLAFCATAAIAAPDRGLLASLTRDELLDAYLECEGSAGAALMDPGGGANCSLLYEEVKQRIFDGDFSRFLAWWQEKRGSSQVGPTARVR